MHSGELAREELGSQHHRAPVLATYAQQRKRLVHDVICGYQQTLVLRESPDSGRMIGVSRHHGGKPGAGIDENQFAHG